MAMKRIVISAAFIQNLLMDQPPASAIDAALNGMTPRVLRDLFTPSEPAAATVPDAEWGGWVGPARITRAWTNGVVGVSTTIVTRVVAIYEFPDDGWPARFLVSPPGVVPPMDYASALTVILNARLAAIIPTSGIGTYVAGIGAITFIGTGLLTSAIGPLYGGIVAGYLLSSYVDSSNVHGTTAFGSLVVPHDPPLYLEARNGPLADWRSGRMANTNTRNGVNSSLACADEVPDGPQGSYRQVCAPEALGLAVRNVIAPTIDAVAKPGVDLLKWATIAVAVVATSYIGYRIVDSQTTRRTEVIDRRTA
jgi:hypothetical protein